MSPPSHAERAARVHTHVSNRKARDIERKVVFKSVLESPFNIKWPFTPSNIQNAVLARILEMMQGVAEYHLARQLASRKGKKRRRAEKKAKSRDTTLKKNHEYESGTGHTPVLISTTDLPEELPAEPESSNIGMGISSETEDAVMDEQQPASPPMPAILSHLSVGINEVSKSLEVQMRRPRHIMSTSALPMQSQAKEIQKQPHSPTRLVLVCRSDVDPPLLIAHIPQLVAACNSNVKDVTQHVKLVSLPKNAEFSLAEVMGLRRVAALALDAVVSEDPVLAALLESVPTIVAPWLVAPSLVDEVTTPETNSPQSHRGKKFIPTHVKQLRTTAPKDMRAAKEQRAKGRAEAKRKGTNLKKVTDARKKAQKAAINHSLQAETVNQDV